ncbi:MAG: hypothetical protein FGM32_07270 [Candidatus Kapabacteria bacterium]|nr:hypothetical protein [Candidatus Kapabacteria bacterium]
MLHILLSIITMGVVWYAWITFKKIGRLRAEDLELTEQERQQRQVSYVMRIVVCLVILALLPFLFTFLIK